MTEQNEQEINSSDDEFISNEDHYLWNRKQQKYDYLIEMHNLLNELKISREDSEKKIVDLTLELHALEKKIDEMIIERTVMANSLVACGTSNVEEILSKVLEQPLKNMKQRTEMSEDTIMELRQQLQDANNGWEDALQKIEVMELERTLINNNLQLNPSIQKLQQDFEDLKQHISKREEEVIQSDYIKDQEIKQLKNQNATLLHELHSVTNKEYKLETNPDSIFSDEPVYLCTTKSR